MTDEVGATVLSDVDRQDLMFRRGDLAAGIAAEVGAGRNTKLLHAARRMLGTVEAMLSPNVP